MSANSPNKQELFRLAKDAIKEGQKQPARIMLQQILQQDKRNVRAMMYMAKIADTAEDRTQWLERILKVDPKNETARKALGKLEKKESSTRNKLYLQIGSVAYVIVLALLCFMAILLLS